MASVMITTIQGSIHQGHEAFSEHSTTSFPGYSLYLEKVPWLRLVTCLCKQPKTHRGWVLNLILSTLSREVKVALLYRRYFESEASLIFVRDPA